MLEVDSSEIRAEIWRVKVEISHRERAFVGTVALICLTGIAGTTSQPFFGCFLIDETSSGSINCQALTKKPGLGKMSQN